MGIRNSDVVQPQGSRVRASLSLPLSGLPDTSRRGIKPGESTPRPNWATSIGALLLATASSRLEDELVVQCVDISFQAMATHTSTPGTVVLLGPASPTVPTTSLSLTNLPVLLSPTTLSPMGCSPELFPVTFAESAFHALFQCYRSGWLWGVEVNLAINNSWKIGLSQG